MSLAPIAVARAEQVLEIPQVKAPATSAPTPADTEATPVSPRYPRPEAVARRDDAPAIPSNVGSLEEYERQDTDDASSPRRNPPSGIYGPGAALAGANFQIDPGGNRQALTSDLVLGALMLGVFAMEMNEAHQHRHR